jgi:hypothetical protein
VDTLSGYDERCQFPRFDKQRAKGKRADGNHLVGSDSNKSKLSLENNMYYVDPVCTDCIAWEQQKVLWSAGYRCSPVLVSKNTQCKCCKGLNHIQEQAASFLVNAILLSKTSGAGWCRLVQAGTLR